MFSLYLISNIINNQIPQEQQLPEKLFKRGSLIISLILLGIIFGVKSLFETLGYFNNILLIFNNQAFSFAIITTIFYLLYKKLIYNKIALEKVTIKNPFEKIFKIFILLTWIVSLIFISIPLLNLDQTQDLGELKVDIFYLGFTWAIFTIGFDMAITLLFNRLRPIDKQIPKTPLKYSMFAGGLISFGIWSLQLIIVELYLSRLFNITLYKQDIRI
ncbi:MAG: hypothetical protein ACFE9R_08525, partial [Candidatus Hermodarchaeota archaeon]